MQSGIEMDQFLFLCIFLRPFFFGVLGFHIDIGLFSALFSELFCEEVGALASLSAVLPSAMVAAGPAVVSGAVVSAGAPGGI